METVFLDKRIHRITLKKSLFYFYMVPTLPTFLFYSDLLSNYLESKVLTILNWLPW